jgi:phosphate-selective porin
MRHCAVLCAAGSFPLPAFFEDGTMDDLLKVLRDRDAISSSNYDNKTVYGAEAATIFGPFLLQGVYMQASVDVMGQSSEPDFSSWYVFGSCFLTGEHHLYKASSDTFRRVKPARKIRQCG